MQNKTYFFFDVDGTVTDSKQTITQEMSDTLTRLNHFKIFISGATKKQMEYQLDKKIFGVFLILAQSGNESPFWKNRFSERDRVEVFRHINQIKNQKEEFFKDKNQMDLLQDRGSQMSFSFIGHNADIEVKKAFDSDGKFRAKILEEIPFFSNSLEVRIGGTTCLDYTHKNGNKGKNIEKLIKHYEWKKEDCIYFGDALFKGGNDESVIGVIDTVAVKNPQDLIEKLKAYVANS